MRRILILAVSPNEQLKTTCHYPRYVYNSKPGPVQKLIFSYLFNQVDEEIEVWINKVRHV